MITFLQVLHRRHISISTGSFFILPRHINICRQVEGNSLYFSFFWLKKKEKKKVNYTGPNEPQNHLLCSWLLFIFITGWMQDVHFSAKCSAAIFGGEWSAISMSVQLKHVYFGSHWGRPVTFRPARTGGFVMATSASPSSHFSSAVFAFYGSNISPLSSHQRARALHTCSPSPHQLRRHFLYWHSLGLVHMYVDKTHVIHLFRFVFFS